MPRYDVRNIRWREWEEEDLPECVFDFYVNTSGKWARADIRSQLGDVFSCEVINFEYSVHVD